MQAPVRDVNSDVAFVLRPHVVATVMTVQFCSTFKASFSIA